MSEVTSKVQNPKRHQDSTKSSKDILLLSDKILSFNLFKNMETTPKSVIFLASCFPKFLFIQMICLDSDKIIKQICFCICFSSLGKAGSSKNLKVFSEKVILFFVILLKKNKTILFKGEKTEHSRNKCDTVSIFLQSGQVLTFEIRL